MGSPDATVREKRLSTLEKKLINAIKKKVVRQLETSGEIRKILKDQMRPANKAKPKNP